MLVYFRAICKEEEETDGLLPVKIAGLTQDTQV